MSRVGFRPAGVKIKTDAGIAIDQAFLAHFQVTPLAAAVAAVLAQTNLAAEAQEITTGITNPDVCRNLKIVANVAGVVGNVVIHAKNYRGEDVTVTLTANGVTEVEGSGAIKEITQIDLPAQTHTPTQQTETKEVTHAVNSEADGDVTLEFTGDALDEASPYSLVVPLTDALDDVTKVAAALVDAINADETLSAVYTASNEAGVITLTVNAPAANDTSLAVAFTDTDTTGVTMGASTNGTEGVPYDKISVGYGDILGLPYMLSHNTVLKTYLNNVLEGTAPAVVVDDDEIDKNTIDLYSALDGNVVDVYMIV